MSKLITNNPKTESVTLKDIKEHKMFKDQEFSFTVAQIVDMCSEDKTLDEHHEQQYLLKGIEGLTDNREVAKFRFEYMLNKSKTEAKVFKRLLYVLAFFPSGMILDYCRYLNESEGFDNQL